MKNRTLWLVAIVAAFVSQRPAQADENRGTLEQQMACTPDVFRLCGSEIPDANRIVACLKQNIAQLGDPCKAVFDAQDSAPKDPVQPVRTNHRAVH
jgi:hypothetical protein